jgi:hypothetical protein
LCHKTPATRRRRDNYRRCDEVGVVVRLGGPAAGRGDWRRLAACRGRDPEEFHRRDGETPKRFEARGRLLIADVCAGCPVRRKCLVAELMEASVAKHVGVRGGLLPDEVAALHRGLINRDVLAGVA